MFENLVTLVIIILILWVGAFGYYLYTSRQQREIVDQVEKLREKLNASEEKDGR